jgi:thiosulfate/3-mercaptopyruvate sulfurtransferase
MTKPAGLTEVAMKKYLFCFIIFITVFTAPGTANANDNVCPLLSPDWLQKNLDNPSVVILDIRKVEDYKEGHIPGALSLTYAAWRTMDSNLGCQLPHKDELSDTICSSGINADTHVVIVGNTDTEQQLMNATRVAWTLKYAGVKHPSILDGGFKKWVSSKYPASTNWVKRPKSNYKCKFNENIVTTKRYVKSHLKEAAIVDVRSERLYKGEIADPMLQRKGHIPGAVNLPYFLVFKKDGTFEDTKKLKLLASKAVGDVKDKEIIVLCCNGQFASSWWFALSEMLGYIDVKIYDGSMEEWCGDKDMPLEP